MKVALLSLAMLVALAKGENCNNAVTRGVVGRSCGTDVVVVHDHRRLSLPGTSGSLKCNFLGKCESDSIFVTLGNGCFWCVHSHCARLCSFCWQISARSRFLAVDLRILSPSICDECTHVLISDLRRVFRRQGVRLSFFPGCHPAHPIASLFLFCHYF